MVDNPCSKVLALYKTTFSPICYDLDFAVDADFWKITRLQKTFFLKGAVQDFSEN